MVKNQDVSSFEVSSKSCYDDRTGHHNHAGQLLHWFFLYGKISSQQQLACLLVKLTRPLCVKMNENSDSVPLGP